VVASTPPRTFTVSPLKTTARMRKTITGNITVKKTEAGLRQNAFWS
jgi:hypothetical protein